VFDGHPEEESTKEPIELSFVWPKMIGEINFKFNLIKTFGSFIVNSRFCRTFNGRYASQLRIQTFV